VGVGDEPLAGAARCEVGLADQRAPAARRDRVGDLLRAVGRGAVREQYDGSLSGVRLGYRAPDPAARARDDRAQVLQPTRPGRFG
jgi:hypothetical protein